MVFVRWINPQDAPYLILGIIKSQIKPYAIDLSSGVEKNLALKIIDYK